MEGLAIGSRDREFGDKAPALSCQPQPALPANWPFQNCFRSANWRLTTWANGGHGIAVSESTGNLIQNNNVSGNPAVGIFLLTGTTGNTVSGNVALGNLVFHDIFDDNAPGANTYQGNTCEVSGGTGAPACPNLPSQ